MPIELFAVIVLSLIVIAYVLWWERRARPRQLSKLAEQALRAKAQAGELTPGDIARASRGTDREAFERELRRWD